MRKQFFTQWLPIAFLSMSSIAFTSCGSEDDEVSVSRTSVVVKEDGTTSNGSIFSAIDDKNFYVDYIKYTIKDGHLVVSGYDKIGFKGVAKIVSSITYKGSSYEVLEIGEDAFQSCKILTSVAIPSSVTSIGSHAFYHCEGLTSVTIPSSVTSIGEYNQEIKGETNVEVIPISA